jgi:hypothetical protein
MHNRVMLGAVVLGLAAVSAACSSSTGPSGACASDERTASLLYGPPLSLSTHADTTIYKWATSSETFISQGSTCTEQFNSG